MFEPTTTESFFERERDRLVDELSSGFEEMMTHTNVLNRKLEEVYGVGKEFTTVAALWGESTYLNYVLSSRRFSALIREQQAEMGSGGDVGVPGTGGANFGPNAGHGR
ncbi:MAG: hypothetical protein TREMPRED_003076 [Tremellales sp. Tagirdzhanova-0007]|nr:MAG: hypothetical protein TREMPRED_003076 [Tremellales sp. Tagirdzhanova-0007]